VRGRRVRTTSPSSFQAQGADPRAPQGGCGPKLMVNNCGAQLRPYGLALSSYCPVNLDRLAIGSNSCANYPRKPITLARMTRLSRNRNLSASSRFGLGRTRSIHRATQGNRSALPRYIARKVGVPRFCAPPRSGQPDGRALAEDRVVPDDICVPGCPPTAKALLYGRHAPAKKDTPNRHDRAMRGWQVWICPLLETAS